MKILELKSIVIEKKNSLQGLNGRFELTGEFVNLKIDCQRLQDLKNREKKELKKNEENLRGIWDTNNHTHICVMRVLKEEKKLCFYICLM